MFKGSTLSCSDHSGWPEPSTSFRKRVITCEIWESHNEKRLSSVIPGMIWLFTANDLIIFINLNKKQWSQHHIFQATHHFLLMRQADDVVSMNSNWINGNAAAIWVNTGAAAKTTVSLFPCMSSLRSCNSHRRRGDDQQRDWMNQWMNEWKKALDSSQTWIPSQWMKFHYLILVLDIAFIKLHISLLFNTKSSPVNRLVLLKPVSK